MKTRTTILTLATILTLSSAQLDAAGYRGLITVYNDGQVAGVDPDTGEHTLLGQANADPWTRVDASAYDPDNDKIYIGFKPSGLVGEVYTLNVQTFAIEDYAGIGYANPYGFAYDSNRGRLLVSSHSTSLLLWELDPTTGRSLGVVADKNSGQGSNSGLAYVADEDALYIFNGTLMKYDISTDQLTEIRNDTYYNSILFGQLQSLCYNPDNGLLYGVTYPGKLGVIDPANGDAFIIDSQWNYSDTQSILFVPEPATMGMLALGGLAVVRRRKRGACK